MSPRVKLRETGRGWETSVDGRLVAVHRDEPATLETAWDLAKSLGTWLLVVAKRKAHPGVRYRTTPRSA